MVGHAVFGIQTEKGNICIKSDGKTNYKKIQKNCLTDENKEGKKCDKNAIHAKKVKKKHTRFPRNLLSE